jgi:site-specific DNA-methyltransferase (adenine-specific)
MIRKEIDHLAISINELQTHPSNVRQGDVGAICESLKAHGQYRPIVFQQSTKRILAGNHTYKAAKALGWTHIAATPIICDDQQALRILLADNKANDLATYDEPELIELLKQLVDTSEGLLGTLFDEDELDSLIQDNSHFELPTDVDDEPMIPLLDQVPEITKPKDVWILGNHKVMCGDCRDDQDVNELIKETKINIAITSPPYAEQRKYDEKSGFKPIHPDQYVDWFADVASNVKKHLADDGSWFVNIKPAANNLDTELYVFDLVLSHARKWGWHFGTEYCWERNGVPKNVVNRFRNGFEPIYQFALGKWKMRPKNVRVPSNDVPISLGEGSGNTGWSDKQGKGAIISKNRLRKNKNGSSKTMADQQGMNVGVGEYTVDGLAYPNNRLPTFAGSHEAVGHTAAFPVGLPAWFIRAYTDENDFVYDPFCGSGSTILAANQENRVAYGMEISPRYVDLICARFQIHTGIHPILEATGEAHDFTPDAD